MARRERMANSEHLAGEVVLGPDAKESLCRQMPCAGGADPTAGRRHGGEACGSGLLPRGGSRARWVCSALFNMMLQMCTSHFVMILAP